MRATGLSKLLIARAINVSLETVAEYIAFAETGKRPQWKPSGGNGKGARPVIYREIDKEVVRLRDAEGKDVPEICQILGRSESTVRKAYDHGRQI